MDFPNFGKNRRGKRKSKKMNGRDEDSNINADDIPEDLKNIVQKLKKSLMLHSEQEIYAILLECKMGPAEAITQVEEETKIKESKSKACFFCPLIDTSNVQRIRNRVAGSSTTSSILGPSPLNSFKKNREEKVRKRNEDNNARKIVQELKEILTLHSEQEIYAMLLECKMDPAEAINRLLSQDSFQEVKSKRGKKREAKEKKSILGEREEETTVNSDNIPAEREVVQKLKEVVNCSEQESCNMNPDEAVNRLLSQDSFQQVESKPDEKKETKDTSDCQGIGSSNQNHEFTNGSDSYVGQCGGNKFNSDETSNVQGIRNHLAGSSTTSNILSPSPLSSDQTKRVPISSSEVVPLLYVPSGQKTMADVVNHLDGSSTTFSILGPPPLNSDLTKRVPISSSEAVHSVSVPSSRLISASGCSTSGQKKWVDVIKMSVDKAPVKDDCPLPEKRKITISFTESASVYNYGGSRSNNKNDETYLVQKGSFEHNQTKDLSACVTVNLVECLASWAKELQNLGSDQPSGLPSRCLNDDSEDNSLNSQLFNPVIDPSELSLQRQNSNTFPKTMHQQAYTREPHPQYSALPLHLPISSLGRRLPLSITEELMASNSEPQMNGQTMNQQAYSREPDPRNSDSLLNQLIPTSSSRGYRLSASKTEAMIMASVSEPQINGQAMNHHYSQPTVPSGHYGSMMNYPYPQPTQNYTCNMSPSENQQHGGNNNAYHLQPLAALLPQHINTDLSPLAVPFVPSTHSSTNGSTYNSAYGFGMSSDNNAANSRFGSVNVFSSLLNNQLTSFQHQIGNSNVGAPQRHNNSRSSESAATGFET